MSYHIQVHRNSKQKHGGYLNSPDVYRVTNRPDSRRLCHTMALRGGESCLRSQGLCRLHGLSDIPSPRITRACTFCCSAHNDQNCRQKRFNVRVTTTHTQGQNTAVAIYSIPNGRFSEADALNENKATKGKILSQFSLNYSFFCLILKVPSIKNYYVFLVVLQYYNYCLKRLVGALVFRIASST